MLRIGFSKMKFSKVWKKSALIFPEKCIQRVLQVNTVDDASLPLDPVIALIAGNLAFIQHYVASIL